FADGPDPAARRRAAHRAEAETADEVRDQLAVRVLADEDVDVEIPVAMGWQEHVLMPEGVEVTAAQARVVRLQVWAERAVAEAERADPAAQRPGPGKGRGLD